jgi:biotin operon repressor
MKVPMQTRISQGKKLLKETSHYLRAKDISEHLKISVSTVYKMISIMRLQGIGIHSTKSGYVLSEYATIQDDVHIMRVINGRRTSDTIMLQAALPYIKERWNTKKDERSLNIISKPLITNISKLSISRKLIESEKEKFLL